MAKQFLVSLNLNKNELQNAVIQNLATAPENAKEGQVYFDTVKKAFFVFQNGAWVTFTSAGVFEAKVAELEGAIAAKVAQSDYDAKVEELEGAIATKVETEAYEAKVEELQGAIDGKVAQSAYDTDKAALEAAIAGKVAQSTYDTDKAALEAADTEIRGIANSKVDQTAYDTKVGELEGAIATKVEQEAYNTKVGELEGAIATKVETEAYEAKVEELQGAIDGKVAQSAYDTKVAELMAEDAKKVDTTTYEAKVAELQGAINGKADKADTLAGYGITDAYTKAEVDAKVSSVYKFKGSVATVEELPTEGNVEGDVYNVTATGENFAWVAPSGEVAGFWDDIGGDVDLTNYYTKEEVDTKIAEKDSLPAQADQAGKALVTDGTSASWDYTTVIKNVDEGTEVGTSKLVINKLTQTKYDELAAAGLINENELYITSDDKEYYTKEEVDAKVDAKVDQSAYDTKVKELEGAIADKVAQSDYDAKVEELEGAIADKVAQSDYDAKVEEIEEAISTLQAGSVHKESYANPELNPVGGVATWSVTHSLGEDVVVSLKEVASGEEVVADVVQSANGLTIKFNAESTVTAGTYKVSIVG